MLCSISMSNIDTTVCFAVITCVRRLPGRAEAGLSRHAAAHRAHQAAVKNDDRVESRSICDGGVRHEVSADGRCHCRIARWQQQHMRAVAVAPPGGLLLTWHEPSSLHLPCGQSWGGHVATSSQRFGGSSSFLHLHCAHTWRTCHRERDARGQVSKEEIDPYYLYLN